MKTFKVYISSPYNIIAGILRHTAYLWPDKTYLKIMFLANNGYELNLKDPKTFCEKIQVLKLRSKANKEFTELVDKVDAKDYVASVIGEDYIIPTLGVWNSFDDIDFSKLPDGFILKCAHDSSKGIVVKDKRKMDIPAMKKRMEYYQHRSYFYENREYPYKLVPRRIIAEKFLVNGNDTELKDYKFFCFNGRAEFCQLIADRTTDETIDFYDRSWKHQDFIGLNPKVHHALAQEPCPPHYDEMLAVADKLATSIQTPFVRIDLYNVNGKIYFGEITFFPASGFGSFSPIEWNYKLGEMIKL